MEGSHILFINGRRFTRYENAFVIVFLVVSGEKVGSIA